MNENNLNKLIPSLVQERAKLPKRGGNYISDADKIAEDDRVAKSVERARRDVRQKNCDCQRCDCQKCDCQRCDCQKLEESNCNC